MRVLAARRLPVHVAGIDPVVGAEDLGARAARRCARIAGDMARLTDGQRGGTDRPAARASECPPTAAIQPALSNEPSCVLLPNGRDLELRALHEELPLGKLDRMDDDPHLVPALLLGSPARVLGFIGPPCFGIGIV